MVKINQNRFRKAAKCSSGSINLLLGITVLYVHIGNIKDDIIDGIRDLDI